MLSSKLPLSSRDMVRFTPERYARADAKAATETAVSTAREKLDGMAEGDAKSRLGRQLAALEADLGRFTTPPVYLIRVPTLQGRAAYNRDLASEGADYPGDGEFLTALEQAVGALLAADEAAGIQAAIERRRGDAGNDEDSAIVDRAMEVLAPHDARIRALRGRRQFWYDTAPLLAARHFLAGAEIGGGEPLMIRRGLGGIATEQALLEHFPAVDVIACGWHAMTLTEVDRATAKN